MTKLLADNDITLANEKKTVKLKNNKKETEIVREICDWLDTYGYFFWRQNNIPVYDKARGVFRALPKYTPRGLPDIIILYEGRLITLEVKAPDYWKYTDDQKAMGEKITLHGGYYFMVTSLQEAREHIHLIVEEVAKKNEHNSITNN